MAVYDQEIVDTTPNYLQSKSYSAQKDRTWFSDICLPGAFSDADFALSLLGGLAYRMSSGKAYVLGQQVADQGMYRVSSLANADLAVGAGHATLPRLDQVILRVMDSTHDGAGFNEARIETVPGTATAGATLDNRSGAANLTTLGEASKNVLLLYDILMAAASSSISGGNVRRRAQLARVGWGTLPDTVPYLTVAQFQALRDFPDGMEVYIIADASSSVIWHVRYNAAGGTYKWEVVGGSPLTAYVATAENVAAGAWNDATTVVSITAPLSGDYIVTADASGSSAYQDGNSLGVGIAVGAITPFVSHSSGWTATGVTGVTTTMSAGVAKYRHAAMVAGTTFRGRYQTAVVFAVGARTLSAMPVRISQ